MRSRFLVPVLVITLFLSAFPVRAEDVPATDTATEPSAPPSDTGSVRPTTASSTRPIPSGFKDTRPGQLQLQERKDAMQKEEGARRAKAAEIKARADENATMFRENLKDRALDRASTTDGRRAEFDAKRDERRAALAEHVKERIRAYVARMVKRFEAALARLEQIAERIQARIDKLESEGRDMAAAQAELDEARGLIGEARAAIEAITPGAESLVLADDPKAKFEALRTLLDAAKNALKRAHASLVEVIVLLKPGQSASGEGSEN